MFDKSTARVSKNAAPVRITFTDGRSLECSVFVAPGGRVIDCLNDERAFLPIDTADGFTTIAKTRIAELAPLGTDGSRQKPANGAEERPAAAAQRARSAYDAYKRPADAWSDDPYEVLGVMRNAPWEAVRAAYLARLKTSHPDRLRAAGVEESLIEAGKELSQRLNAAYAKIASQRKGKAA